MPAAGPSAAAVAAAPANPRVTKLIRAAQRAAAANAYDLPELGLAVTFPTTAPTGGRYVPAQVGGVPSLAWCNFDGTPKIYGSAADHVQQQHGTTSAATQAAGANISQTVSGTSSLTNGFGNNYAVWFDSDTQGGVLKVVAGGGSPYFRIIVDGQYLTKTQGAQTTIPGNRFIQLPTFATRKFRRFKLEMERDAALDGIYLANSETIRPVPEAERTRFAIHLDSYGATNTGSPGSPIWDGPMGVLAKLMGWDALFNSSLSGTGWDNPGTGPAWPFGSHLGDLPANPDGIFLGGMFNDNARDLSVASAKVAAGLAQVRAAYPGVPIIMGGVWSPPIISLATAQATENAQYQGYLQSADPLTAFIRLCTDGPIAGQVPFTTSAIYTGTGNTGALKGDGNADFYIKPDGVHPGDVGYPYTARYLAPRVLAALAAMVA